MIHQNLIMSAITINEFYYFCFYEIIKNCTQVRDALKPISEIEIRILFSSLSHHNYYLIQFA
jgi:hypothetical protein